MKAVKYKNKGRAAWYVLKEFVKEGKGIYLGNGSKKGEPEWHKAIRNVFSDLDLYRNGEEEMEDFLSYLMDEVEIEEGDRDFIMPLPGSTVEYFVVFNDKIWLYVYFSDEYQGMGDSEQYVKCECIVASEGADIEEIKEVKEWLIKGGFKLCK